mmetsp:Transcript_27159/g.63152  ORF Transcript_27159/g.63152 Transcript_27159/m.63152 type:complete len:1050 (+) Transcript_27159:114-3263(+)
MAGDVATTKVEIPTKLPGGQENNNNMSYVHMKYLVHAFEQRKEATMSCCGYFGCCIFATTLVSAGTIMLFSSMGIGQDVLEFLQTNGWLWYPLIGSWLFIFVLLYLFDFFAPPHMPGHFLRLWPEDIILGRFLCIMAVLLLYASFFFLAESYPSLPLIMCISMMPVAVAVVRLLTKPTAVKAVDAPVSPKAGGGGGGEEKQPNSNDLGVATAWREAKVISSLVGNEEDVGIFYRSVLAAFSVTSLLALGIWIVWAINDGQALDELDESHLTNRDRQVLWILWCTPLVVAICNFVFALFAALRVAMHNVYMDTVPDDSAGNDLEAKYQKAIKHVATVVKTIGCFLIVTLGFLYVGAQLLYTDNEIASMIISLLGALFIIFIIFTYLAFNRVVMATSKWLSELPVWRTVESVMKSDWFRALVVCLLLVPTPALLTLAFATQCTRRCRGIYKNYPCLKEAAISNEQEDPETLILTPRVNNVLRKIRVWNRLGVIAKCYVLCGIFFAYIACPIPLNISLSWMKEALSDVDFGIIMVLTFFIGVSAFLLPPVPGMTIYIFGGLMLSSTCPIGGRDSDTAFWVGAVINIGLGWFLKLAACAIQQVCIGGMLGKSLWVRQTIGVHKVSVRCIEKELQRPGLPLGKVAILCGGPDWPTSVLAGILGLSLFQCELGTLPIILFVAPCSLTGSFYLKKGTTEVWTRSANIMILTSVMVNLVLWAIAAWAIQNQLERNYDELTRPRPENVHLAWLDYKQEQIQSSASVTWAQVPGLLKVMYAGCAAVQILLCVAFQFQYSLFFKSFEVSDPIDSLNSWEDVITMMGVAAIGVFAGCWIGAVVFGQWKKRMTRDDKRKVEEKLAQEEEPWKAEWLRKANDWVPAGPRPSMIPAPQQAEKDCQKEEPGGATTSTLQDAPSTAPVDSIGGDFSDTNEVCNEKVADQSEYEPQPLQKEAHQRDVGEPLQVAEEHSVLAVQARGDADSHEVAREHAALSLETEDESPTLPAPGVQVLHAGGFRDGVLDPPLVRLSDPSTEELWSCGHGWPVCMCPTQPAMQKAMS